MMSKIGFSIIRSHCPQVRPLFLKLSFSSGTFPKQFLGMQILPLWYYSHISVPQALYCVNQILPDIKTCLKTKYQHTSSKLLTTRKVRSGGFTTCSYDIVPRHQCFATGLVHFGQTLAAKSTSPRFKMCACAVKNSMVSCMWV